MKRTVLIAAILTAITITAGSAFAATQTANLVINATVIQNCVITTTPLDFGNYDPVVANAATDKAETTAGVVNVACTKGSTGLRIDLGNGANFSGSRRMTNGTDFLAYALHTNAGHTTAWGSGATGLAISNAPSKVSRPFPVYGLIAQNQDVAAGSYTDTVVATINF